MEQTEYTYRNIARLTVEAETPIAVGGGERELLTDSAVIRDINGLPFIPATSMAGVIRHAVKLDTEEDKKLFGYQNRKGGRGSCLLFTDAVMIGAEGKALDGIQVMNRKHELYAAYQTLPVRQHVRINGKGVTEKTGKFDNEVVYKGTRFVFEMELLSAQPCTEVFDKVVGMLYQETLRIGSGTRSGYGKLKVVSCMTATLDLSRRENLEAYLQKSASLAMPWDGFHEKETRGCEYDKDEWVKYSLLLQPQDYFMIGSGMGDDEVDNTPMEESIVVWENGRPRMSRKPQVLIPGCSVKGALAHRTAYNYNKQSGLFVGDDAAKAGGENKAVACIFGAADGKDIRRGNILIDDIIEGDMADKVFFHVKIDAFTGGTIDGALFQEKTVCGKGRKYLLNILVNRCAFEDAAVEKAFETSLGELCSGMLPLGGATNRGNGIFTGEIYKNGEAL